MTSPTVLIQRAAELVIEFGLEHTGMTAAEVRDSAADGALLISWTLPSVFMKDPDVELVIRRRTDRIDAWTSVDGDALRPADAKLVSELYGRVVELAERIEALR